MEEIYACKPVASVPAAIVLVNSTKGVVLALEIFRIIGARFDVVSSTIDAPIQIVLAANGSIFTAVTPRVPMLEIRRLVPTGVPLKFVIQ